MPIFLYCSIHARKACPCPQGMLRTACGAGRGPPGAPRGHAGHPGPMLGMSLSIGPGCSAWERSQCAAGKYRPGLLCACSKPAPARKVRKAARARSAAPLRPPYLRLFCRIFTIRLTYHPPARILGPKRFKSVYQPEFPGKPIPASPSGRVKTAPRDILRAFKSFGPKNSGRGVVCQTYSENATKQPQIGGAEGRARRARAPLSGLSGRGLP